MSGISRDERMRRMIAKLTPDKRILFFLDYLRRWRRLSQSQRTALWYSPPKYRSDKFDKKRETSRRQIGDDYKDFISSRIKQGKSYRAIGLEIGFSLTSVSRFCKKHGLKSRHYLAK